MTTKFTCKKCERNYKTVAFNTMECFYCNPENYMSFFTKFTAPPKR